MKCDKAMMTLYAVTDRRWTGKYSLYEQVEMALKGNVTCVQLREKQLDHDAFLAEAIALKTLCHQYGVPLIINDDVSIMLESDADGVHIGQDDMDVKEARTMIGNDKIIGVSCHSIDEARKAKEYGADYLGIGAVFGTNTKDNVTAMPYERLKSICASVDLPKVAIGGINAQNIQQLVGSGIDGVAVVSALFNANDVEKAACELYKLSKQLN